MKLYLLLFITIASVLMPLSQSHAQANCLPTRLVVGEQGFVIPPDPNRLRAEPSTSSEQIGVLEPNIPFEVLETGTCTNGIIWVRVRAGTREGWTAEGNASAYFIEPIASPTATPTATATVVPTQTPTATATIDPLTLENNATGCAVVSLYWGASPNEWSHYGYDFSTTELFPLQEPVAHIYSLPSPDGLWLAFYFAEQPNPSESQTITTLYFQSTKTGAIVRVDENLSVSLGNTQSWSSDSAYFAFVESETAPDGSIYTLHIVTPSGEPVLSQVVPEYFYHMSWSIDNQTVILDYSSQKEAAIDVLSGETVDMPVERYQQFRYGYNLYPSRFLALSEDGSRSVRMTLEDSGNTSYVEVYDEAFNARAQELLATQDTYMFRGGVVSRPCEWLKGVP